MQGTLDDSKSARAAFYASNVVRQFNHLSKSSRSTSPSCLDRLRALRIFLILDWKKYRDGSREARD